MNMKNNVYQEIKAIAQNQLMFLETETKLESIKENQIRGKTIVSLISPGTELSVIKNISGQFKFPISLGYACVFQVDEIGEKVKHIQKGDIVFFSGKHASLQTAYEQDVIKVPSDLDPKIAVFARMMGISMSTLTTTNARPPQAVVITGLGLVGNLAAQIFSACGYYVIGIDPSEEKREIAIKAGLKNIYKDFSGIEKHLIKKISLTVECSGHEDAIYEACQITRKGGEIVMVGVPWNKRSDRLAFDILHLIFHNYIVLRSGWEWEVPRQPQDFIEGSLITNYEGAIRWLSENKIHIKDLAKIYSPKNPQQAYDDLINQKTKGLTCMFDWNLIE